MAGLGTTTTAQKSGSVSGTGSASDGLISKHSTTRLVNGLGKRTKAKSDIARSPTEDATPGKENPFFFVDVKPTPVHLTGIAIESPKQDSILRDHDAGKKIKQAKTATPNDNEVLSTPKKIAVEFEDISQEVDARLKVKEEKRKRKKDKKRKKDNEITSGNAPEAAITAEEPGRPNKKKKLRQDHDVPTEVTETKKRHGAESEQGQGETRKKRRKKNKPASDS